MNTGLEAGANARIPYLSVGSQVVVPSQSSKTHDQTQSPSSYNGTNAVYPPFLYKDLESPLAYPESPLNMSSNEIGEDPIMELLNTALQVPVLEYGTETGTWSEDNFEVYSTSHLEGSNLGTSQHYAASKSISRPPHSGLSQILYEDPTGQIAATQNYFNSYGKWFSISGVDYGCYGYAYHNDKVCFGILPRQCQPIFEVYAVNRGIRRFVRLTLHEAYRLAQHKEELYILSIPVPGIQIPVYEGKGRDGQLQPSCRCAMCGASDYDGSRFPH
jgi:hypothetical protein